MLTHRQFLLEPNSIASIKIERYMMRLGTIKTGEVDPVLEQTAEMVFRPDRIAATAHIDVKIPWWIRAFLWVAFPWLVKVEDYSLDFDSMDEDDDGMRWRLRWFHPFQTFKSRRIQREQQRMLASCMLVSVMTDDIEALAMPVFLHDFYVGNMPRLDLPTINPGRKIECKFRGVAACDITVMIMGFSPVRV
jgi:hypothetical protein